MASIGQQLLAPEVGWKRYDNNNPRIIYTIPSGSWQDSNDVNCYNGSSKYVAITNAKVIFKFTGTKIRLMEYCGQYRSNDIKITIDGVTETVSQLTGSGYQTLFYEKTGLSEGTHSLEMRLNNAAYAGLDSIDTDENAELYHPFFNVKDKVSDLKNLGDAIICRYTAASNTVGVFSELGTSVAPLIPPASSATPDGSLYLIYCGTDHLGRKMLMPDRNIQHSISWNTLNSAGVASGCGVPISIVGVTSHDLTCKLPTGGISATDKDNHWDKIIAESTLGGVITANDGTVWNHDPTYSWMSTTPTISWYGSTNRVLPSKTAISVGLTDVFAAHVGFRPLILAEALAPSVTITLPTPNTEYKVGDSLLLQATIEFGQEFTYKVEVQDSEGTILATLVPESDGTPTIDHNISVTEEILFNKIILTVSSGSGSTVKTLSFTDHYLPVQADLSAIDFHVTDRILITATDEVGVVTTQELIPKTAEIQIVNFSVTSEVHTEDPQLQATLLSDKGKIRYRILLDATEVTTWSEFTVSPVSVSRFIPNSSIAVGTAPTVKLEVENTAGDTDSNSGVVAKNNAKPTISAQADRLTISGVISDTDGDKVKYRLKVNGNYIMPWTSYQSVPLQISLKLKSTDVNIDKVNTLVIEYMDNLSSTTETWVKTFVPSYQNIMFIHNNLYVSDDEGNPLNVVDFGPVMAGKTSQVLSVTVKNMTGKEIPGLKLWVDPVFPLGTTLQLSASLEPFVSVQYITHGQLLDNESFDIYFKVSATRQATLGGVITFKAIEL